MVLETSKQPYSLSDICSLTQSTFHHYPCLLQAKTVEAILKRDRDVVIQVIAGMGMGKTLTLWMPLFFFPVGYIQVVITLLNLLGKQNVELLEKAGLKAIFIGADMVTPENFLVSNPINLIMTCECRPLLRMAYTSPPCWKLEYLLTAWLATWSYFSTVLLKTAHYRISTEEARQVPA